MLFSDSCLPGQLLGKRSGSDVENSTPSKKRKEDSALTSYPTPESTQSPSTDSASEESSPPGASISSLKYKETILKERGVNTQSKVFPVDWAKAGFLGDLDNYIPLGSLTLRPSIGGGAFLHQTAWIESTSEHTCDLWLAFHDYLTPKDGHPAFSARKLAESQWIRVFARKHQEERNLATLRIYVLPDDVGRRYVDRQASRNLRGHLEHLVNKVDTSSEAWAGHTLQNHIPTKYSNETTDSESLFYLFNTLPSPAPNTPIVSCPISSDAILSVLHSEDLPGLKTQMYSYQKRTVAAMIKREVEPAKSLDPRFQVMKAPTGRSFYYDDVTITLLRDRREYSEPCGGILGESMGLGKTLICLATILATKGHWPEIPPEFSVDVRPPRPRVGSLMAMAAAAVGRARVPWRAMLQESSRAGEDHANCLAMLEDNVVSYTIPPPEAKYSKRSSATRKGITIRLSSATLIIVPQNLLSQWREEISTHVENDRLNVLYVDTAKELPLPSAEKLSQYDIVLMCRPRFEREMVPSGGVKTSSKAKKVKGGCLCSLDHDCHCNRRDEYQTPLKSLHFLRIIMDEGHEFSSTGRGGNAYWALRNLNVDRKWIVSGTPANGLFGVEVGTAAFETTNAPNNTSISYKKSNQNVLEARRKESALTQERKDLEKLGILVTGFLQVKPWANSKDDDPASWQKYVMPHDDGRRKARSLRTLLQSLVVRHQIEDIEADIKLPELHNRVVYLQPSWQDKLSINLFILFLTANAVTSERVDEDYMFHSKNRRQLHTLINNLRHSGFYWTGIAPEDVAKTIKVSRTYLEEHPGSHCSASDRKLLERAISIGETIQASSSWKAFAELHEMGIFVEDFPAKARSSWSLVPDQQSKLLLTGATQLAKAQQWVDNHLYATDPTIGLAGVGTTTMQKLRQSFADPDPSQHRHPNLGPLSRKQRLEPPGVPRLTNERTVSRAKAAPAPRKSKKKQPLPQSSTLSGTNLSSGLKSALKPALKSSAVREPLELLPADSVLKPSKICGTASAKLSYLLDKVSILHHDEKILIFYEGDTVAWYLAQAFDMLDIRYLIYTKTLSQERKTAYINTFNATETFRVLLMNVHQAAHGLHIASASRVFFVNPIWQPNVEAQAIKRAHRIGQTRPVYVETLVLKDTLEDQMLQRRKGMTAQEHQKAEKSLLDDDTMSTIIQNARFIPLPAEELHDMEQQAAKLNIPQQLFARVGKGEGDMDDPDADLIFPENMPITKRQKKTQNRKASRASARRDTMSTVSPSPFPENVSVSVANALSPNLSLQDDNISPEPGAPGPSSRKRKNSDEHAPDLDAPPSPIRRAQPTGLAYPNSAEDSFARRVGFTLDAEIERPSLFGGSSSAGTSSLKRKSDSEYAPELDGSPVPARRTQSASLKPESSSYMPGSSQSARTSEVSTRRDPMAGSSSTRKLAKKVGFTLETDVTPEDLFSSTSGISQSTAPSEVSTQGDPMAKRSSTREPAKKVGFALNPDFTSKSPFSASGKLPKSPLSTSGSSQPARLLEVSTQRDLMAESFNTRKPAKKVGFALGTDATEQHQDPGESSPDAAGSS